MNELSSAEAALAALRPVLGQITAEQLRWPTPCPGLDVAKLADHLIGTITMVAESAGQPGGFGEQWGSASARPADDQPRGFGEQWGSASARPGGIILTRVSAAAESAIAAWRRRGTGGDAVFAGRVMPARLALGVLSVELVVHGWDFAQALERPLPIAAEHSDFVLALARQIITPDSRRTAGFDEPVAVGADAAPLDRLVAYTGREPRSRSQTTDFGTDPGVSPSTS